MSAFTCPKCGGPGKPRAVHNGAVVASCDAFPDCAPGPLPRLRRASEAFRAAWPAVFTDLQEVCDRFPDVPMDVKQRLPREVREVVEDALAEFKRGAR